MKLGAMPPRWHWVHPHDGSCGCDHDMDTGIKTSLYKYIDTMGVKCLNATREEDAVKVLKTFDKRLDMTDVVKSDADETLIFTIPFNGSITLKSIDIAGPPGSSHPATMKAYVNRDDIDFDSVDDIECVQEWIMVDGICSYETRVAKFQGVYSLTLYFPENFGADETVISYIGLYGTCLEMRRGPVIACYEVLGNASDNQMKSDNIMQSGVGF